MAISPPSERTDRRLHARRVRTGTAGGLLVFWTVLVGVAWGEAAALALLALLALVLGTRVARAYDVPALLAPRVTALGARARTGLARVASSLPQLPGRDAVRAPAVAVGHRVASVSRSLAHEAPVLAQRVRGAAGARRGVPPFAPLVLVAVLGIATAVILDRRVDREQHERERALAGLVRDLDRTRSRLAVLTASNEALTERVARLARRPDTAAVTRRLQRSLVTVESAAGAVSGWAAWTSPAGTFVVTSESAVAGVTEIELRGAGGIRHAQVVGTDARTGLALLRAERGTAPPLWQRAALAGRPARGETARVVASPYGASGLVVEAVVGGVGPTSLQAYVPDADGVEGAPVVNAGGAVVGVVTETSSSEPAQIVPVGLLCARLRRC